MRLLFLANKEPLPKAPMELLIVPDKMSFTLFENSAVRGAYFHEQWHRRQTDLCASARVLDCAVFRPAYVASYFETTLSTAIVFPRIPDGDASVLEHWLPVVHGVRREEFFFGAELQVHVNSVIRFDRRGSVACDRLFGHSYPPDIVWDSWQHTILETLSRVYCTRTAA